MKFKRFTETILLMIESLYLLIITDDTTRIQGKSTINDSRQHRENAQQEVVCVLSGNNTKEEGIDNQDKAPNLHSRRAHGNTMVKLVEDHDQRQQIHKTRHYKHRRHIRYMHDDVCKAKQ